MGCDEMKGVGRVGQDDLGHSKLHWAREKGSGTQCGERETRQGCSCFVEVAACRAETADSEPSTARTKTDRHRG